MKKFQKPEPNLQDVVSQRVDSLIYEIAQASNCSLSTFYRRYKKLTDVPPGKEKNKIQIAYSKKLLIETNLSIHDIAIEVGFKHTSALSATYKRVMGITPSEERKKAQKEKKEMLRTLKEQKSDE